MAKVTRLTGGEHADNPQALPLRETPGEAHASRAGVGQELRNARLARGNELGQVSYALRIRKDYLDALESDRPEILPGRTYAIGFLRAYAMYLGLDAPALVSRYKAATAGVAESAPQVGPAPEAGGVRWNASWLIGAFATTAVLAYGAYELSRPSAPQLAAVGASPLAQTRARHPGSTVQTVAAQRPHTDQVAAPGLAAAPTGQVFGAQNRSARVVLHADALARVLVEGTGGKVYINRVLHPGDVYRVPNLVGLSLTTADGGAVSLELDGRDLGHAGPAGHMIEALSLDPRAIVIGKAPAFPVIPKVKQ